MENDADGVAALHHRDPADGTLPDQADALLDRVLRRERHHLAAAGVAATSLHLPLGHAADHDIPIGDDAQETAVSDDDSCSREAKKPKSCQQGGLRSLAGCHTGYPHIRVGDCSG